jgi:hypothetical protein
VHDPTNALQTRLREAEREVFRLELQQVTALPGVFKWGCWY